MRAKYVGNKADKLSAVIRNAEASSTINRGMPVVLNMNGTNDGLDVVLPSTAGAVKTAAFRYGVALTDLNPGDIGEAMMFGECDFVRLTLQTRANTSGGSSFSTADTVALGLILTIVTQANAFSTAAVTVAAASSADQTLSLGNQDYARIGQSLASAAGIATTSTETRTAITQGVKAFLRMM